MEYYSCEEYEKDIYILAKKIRDSGRRFTHICPILRGGAVISTSLSHILKLHLLTDYCKINESTLVVDDIVDTAFTKNRFCGFAFATLHVRNYTSPDNYPDFFVDVKCDLIQYWWEV
jgi:hypoxanthine phosphoribosyltransferase